MEAKEKKRKKTETFAVERCKIVKNETNGPWVASRYLWDLIRRGQVTVSSSESLMLRTIGNEK